MQNPVPDERYYVANEAILGAFFKLSREKAPDKITVSDIIKAAGIARSTFLIITRISPHWQLPLKRKQSVMFFP